MSKRLEGQTDKIVDTIEWFVCIIIAVVLALAVRFYVGTPTVVKQQSMKNTLMPNERLWLSRLTRTTHKTPKRGDIITFEAPTASKEDGFSADYKAQYLEDSEGAITNFIYYVLEIGKTSYIKRVIGEPGDRVQIKNGGVYVNGKLINEPYLREGITTEPNGGKYIDITVPEGYVYCLGDNRPESKDCRHLGCIPIEKIESEVVIRFWPLSKFGKVN